MIFFFEELFSKHFYLYTCVFSAIFPHPVKSLGDSSTGIFRMGCRVRVDAMVEKT